MVVGTMCIPEGDDVQELLTALFDNLDDNLNFGKYIADFQLCWKAIVGMCGLSFFIAFIYIFLLKWITKPLLYISMFLILAMFILLGIWCWLKRTEYNQETQKKNY